MRPSQRLCGDLLYLEPGSKPRVGLGLQAVEVHLAVRHPKGLHHARFAQRAARAHQVAQRPRVKPLQNDEQR